MTDTTAIYNQLRDNTNLPPLTWHVHPTAGEALIDRVKITIPGSIEFPTEHMLRDWFDHLTDNMLDQQQRFFGNGDSQNPTSWKVRSVTQGWTLRGELAVKPRGRAASWRLALDLNLTRTLVHLLSRYTPDQFPQLHGRAFFAAHAGATRASPALDQRDNMIPGRYIPRALHARERFYTSFLETYEFALQRFVQEVMFPAGLGFFFTYSDRAIVAPDPETSRTPIYSTESTGTIRVDWGGITLQQCEVYWEQKVARALPWMRTFADQALAAARDVRIRRYDTERELAVAREAGSLVVTIPLDASRSHRKAEKELVVYAKDDNRIRFEVRYYANLPDAITAPRDPVRLSRLFVEARNDALPRLPWDRLGDIMREAPVVPATEIIPLMEFTRRATEGHTRAFRATLEALLLTGGVSEAEEGGWATPALLDQLVRNGVLEPIKLVRNQRGTRRYRLARRYQGLLELFRSAETDAPDDPAVPT